MKDFSLLAAVIAFACCAGCAHGPGKLPPPRAYGDIDRSFDRKMMTAELGDAIRINLPAGAGYTWRVAANNSSVLLQIAGAAFPADPPGRAGASGTTTITFQAVNAGQSLVRLVYERADQRETTPENTFEVTIRVVSPPPPKTEKK